MAEQERISLSKYTEEFKRNAIELMKQAGITKACKELKLAHCTIYRWCRELEGASSNEPDDTVTEDIDALIEERLRKEQPPAEPDAQGGKRGTEASGTGDQEPLQHPDEKYQLLSEQL